ncbi:ABC transporter, ATP-binding protein [Teladorsagia circumcincta]|uniref:ABC transporter, ATP-binding protein n=1 Tax=Teladorsagia circumcincta TaxID=45464 RepID=A0A2G9UXA4_TELCI|nr:ABC transporter, ATP-binding protein [Teladorsagia circumcincta]
MAKHKARLTQHSSNEPENKESVKLCQPLFMGRLIRYFRFDAPLSEMEAYVAAGGVAMTAALFALIHHPYFYGLQKVGLQLKVAASGMLVNKGIRLSSSALHKTTVGHMVNLLSTDINKFDMAFLELEEFSSYCCDSLTYKNELNQVRNADSETKEESKALLDHEMNNVAVINEERKKFVEEGGRVVAQSLTTTWQTAEEEGEDLYAVKNLNLEANPGDLVAVIGPVGSGKSSLLSSLLCEARRISGKLTVSGKIGYCSQDVWIFSGTIRDNILFGCDYDQENYRRALEISALSNDIAQFPRGDAVLVGDRGTSLSGGQKARIALARAIYSDADVFLLDDPLSAVDATVGRFLFEKCICGHLKNKVVVLVTHQIQFLHHATKVLLMKNGDVVAVGTLDELKNNFTEQFEALIQETERSYAQRSPTEGAPIGSPRRAISRMSEGDRGALPNLFIIDSATFERSTSCISEKDEKEVVEKADYVPEIIEEDKVAGKTNASERAVAARRSNSTVDEDRYTFFGLEWHGALNFFGIIFVILILNPIVFVPTLPLLILFFLLRVVYLASSRDVKRLEATTRSPLYSHISAFMNGLYTVRAYGRQKEVLQEYHRAQNVNTAAFGLTLSTSRWFAVCIDWLVALFVSVVAFFSVLTPASMTSGEVALMLVYAVQLTGFFSWIMRQSAELQNGNKRAIKIMIQKEWHGCMEMVSVERIVQYTELESEHDSVVPLTDVPKSWPTEGHITITNMFLKYDENENGEFILKNICLDIKPREKIGIVGRTGAGKSSLLRALFRLTPPASGTVMIDDVNTALIPLKTLRRAIAIIPQEPVLFIGSLRRNLDPFNQHSDDELWKVIEQVGQRQLVCLARALLRNSRILVIDEATANVDPRTDTLIQRTIRESFSHATVLTIAHRLNTIMDSSRVLVLKDGEVAEFGPAHELLKKSSGVLKSLVEETGEENAALLYKIVRPLDSLILYSAHPTRGTGVVVTIFGQCKA